MISIQNKPVLSGSVLKLFAAFAMLADHVALHLFSHIESACTVFYHLYGYDLSIYTLCRGLGRMAFPLFAFLLVEGALHTHNRKRYGALLLLFAIISEIPWNLIYSNHWLYPSQNVLFTLFLGLVAIDALERYQEKIIKMSLILLGTFGISILLNADYGYTGYVFIIALYLFRSNLPLMALVGIYLLPSHWIGGLAFILIALYNGQRGFIKGKIGKYFFYLFYPLHLLILYGCKLYLFE